MNSISCTEQSLWEDVPCWVNKDQELIRSHFEKVKTTQVYVEREAAIECLEWSSADLCPTRNIDINTETQLTNKMLIGLSDGSIKLL